MRRTWFMALGVCVFLSGCGNLASDDSLEGKIQENIMQEAESSEDEETEQLSVKEDFSSIVETEYVELKNASNFSEGIAWVEYEDEFGEDHIGWLYENGKIIVPEALVTAEIFGGEFSGGYTYVNYNYNSFAVLDQNGNVTAESPEGEGYEIVSGGDGIFLVRQMVRTFDVNEDRYGVIDANGNWLYELTVNLFYEDSVNTGQTIEYFYLGEHIFGMRFGRNEHFFDYYTFDAETGIAIHYEDRTPIYCYNGKTIVYSEDEVSFNDANGTAIHTIVPEHGEMTFGPICSEGLMFVGDYSYDGQAQMSIVENAKFYNMDGDIELDLSQYTLIANGIDDLYHFEDGVAPVVLLGADYAPYLSFINRSGDLLFEPIEVASYYVKNEDAFGVYSDGVAPTIIENADGVSINVIISRNGEIKELDGKVRECKDLEFHNGYTIRTENYMVSSDAFSTRYYFMGTDGTTLNTYLENK